MKQHRIKIYPFVAGAYFVGLVFLFLYFKHVQKMTFSLFGLSYLAQRGLYFVLLFVFGILCSFGQIQKAFRHPKELRLRPLRLTGGLLLLAFQIIDALLLCISTLNYTLYYFLMAVYDQSEGIQLFFPFLTACLLATSLAPKTALGEQEETDGANDGLF